MRLPVRFLSPLLCVAFAPLSAPAQPLEAKAYVGSYRPGAQGVTVSFARGFGDADNPPRRVRATSPRLAVKGVSVPNRSLRPPFEEIGPPRFLGLDAKLRGSVRLPNAPSASRFETDYRITTLFNRGPRPGRITAPWLDLGDGKVGEGRGGFELLPRAIVLKGLPYRHPDGEGVVDVTLQARVVVRGRVQVVEVTHRAYRDKARKVPALTLTGTFLRNAD